jgi:hypothetical protein
MAVTGGVRCHWRQSAGGTDRHLQGLAYLPGRQVRRTCGPAERVGSFAAQCAALVRCAGGLSENRQLTFFAHQALAAGRKWQSCQNRPPGLGGCPKMDSCPKSDSQSSTVCCVEVSCTRSGFLVHDVFFDQPSSCSSSRSLIRSPRCSSTG